MKGIFNTTPYLLSCDWGTTSFRLSLIDRAAGQCIGKLTSEEGIKKVYTRWTNSGSSTSRVNFYLAYVQEQIEAMAGQCNRSLRGIPIIVSGMASSSIGFTELPYASLPFPLYEPTVPSQFFPESEEFPHDLFLLSGLRAANDVMRGEEMQLLGLAATQPLNDGVCILPGTHSKHVFVEGNEVTNFKTYMSGEIFELLSSHSILSSSVHATGKSFSKEAFHDGVELALKNDFLHSMFGIRTNDLLHGLDKAINADLLSGLVIGTELTHLVDLSASKIFLLGSSILVDRYSEALDYLELDAIPVSNIDDLTTKGHLTILKLKT